MSNLFETYKDEGNAFFKAEAYEKAVQAYNKCIERDTENPIGYSNKAMALIKLGSYQDAINACNEGILKLNPKETKHIALKKKLSYRLEMAKNLLKEQQDKTVNHNEATKRTKNSPATGSIIDLPIEAVNTLPLEYVNL